MHSPTRPPFALVLSDRPYNAELLAAVIVEAGLASLERPVQSDSLRLVRQMRPDVVFVVGDPENESVLQLTTSVAREEDRSVVALLPRYSGAHEARVLQAGADVCLHDSDSSELAVATVQALLRRQTALRTSDTTSTTGRLELGPICLDRDRYEVTANGQHVGLTAHEYQVFLVLANNANRVLSPREALEGATGRFYSEEEARETLKVYIQRIRNKLNEAGVPRNAIVNIRGFGYMLQEPVGAEASPEVPGAPFGR